MLVNYFQAIRMFLVFFFKYFPRISVSEISFIYKFHHLVFSHANKVGEIGMRIKMKYYHPQTDCFIVSQLFSVARHVGCLKLGSKPAQVYVRLCIIPLSPRTNLTSGIIRHCVIAFVSLHLCLIGYQSAQFIRRALHYANGSLKFLRQSAQPPWGAWKLYWFPN